MDDAHRASPSAMMAALRSDAQLMPCTLERWARDLFLIRQVRIVRPGEAAKAGPAGDGSFVFSGLAAASLLDILQLGLRTRAAVGQLLRPLHRVAVFDTAPAADGAEGEAAGLRVTHIVAQSDLVAFLLFHSQAGKLGEISAKTVAQLGWLRGDADAVLCVPLAMPTVAAFAAMINAGVSAAGVVEELVSGAPLLSSISVSDVRAFSEPNDFERLTQTVGSFLGYGQEGPPAELGAPGASSEGSAGDQGRLWLVSCGPEATLEHVMRLLVTFEVHRVYIVDGQKRPLGVVTMSDCLGLFAEEQANAELGDTWAAPLE
jgi:CBS domain-containing protein